MIKIYSLSTNIAIRIFIVLLILSSFFGTFISTAQAAINTSFSSIQITPKTAALGQRVTITTTVSPPPPAGESYGIQVSVIDINGNYRVLSWNSTTQAETGKFYFSWIPDIRGTYSLTLTYPGGTLAGNTYSSCQGSSSFYVDPSLPTPTPQPSLNPTPIPTASPQINIANGQAESTPVVLWHKTGLFSGACDAIQTSDGGYAIISSQRGCLLLKLDSEGNTEWSKTYNHTTYSTYPKSVVQTSDGGYAVAGFAQSIDGHAGYVWLFKTDSEGTLLWNKALGDDKGYQGARCVIQTSDGGFAVTGDYGGYDGYEGPNGWNFLFMKTDSEGNLEWTKVIGKRDDDRATAIIQTSDGGYALTGCTSVPGNYPMFWLVKTDSVGNMQWNQSYPETDRGWSYGLTQSTDGGFALVGTSGGWSGSVSTIWLLKTDSEGHKQWLTSIGETMSWATCVIQTIDGGYAVAGGDDFQLAKTDAKGNLQWTYNDGVSSSAIKVVQTQDERYLLVGGNELTKLSASSHSLQTSSASQPTNTPTGTESILNEEQQSTMRYLPIYVICSIIIADIIAFTIIILLRFKKRKASG